MATQLIVLDTPIIGGDRVVNYVMWLYPIAANQQYYTKSSSAKSSFVRATAQNNTDIQNGVVVEESYSFLVPSGWTIAQIKAELQNRYTVRSAAFVTEQNKWNFQGNSFDGTGWVVL
jgi:hypothetical protein